MKNLTRSSSLFLALILLSATLLPAQTRDVFILKCTPTTLFNFERAHLLLNAELRPDRRLGIEASWGLATPFMEQFLQLTYKTEQKFQIVRAEVRVYPWQEEPFYFAAEGYQITETYTRSSGGSYFNLAKEYLYYTSAEVSRTLWGASLKAGRVVRLNESIRLEVYAGAGIRERNTVVVAENTRAMTPPRLIFGPRLTEGRTVLPQLLVGLRVGYAFKTRTSAPAKPILR